MKQAFALTVLLLGVMVAILVLQRRATHAPPVHGDGAARQAASRDGSVADGGASTIRFVSLTRLSPRYALSLPTPDPTATRDALLRHLAARGGKPMASLPTDLRAPFFIEVPAAAFKALLADLGLGKGDLRLRSLPARAVTGGPPTTEIEVTLSPP